MRFFNPMSKIVKKLEVVVDQLLVPVSPVTWVASFLGIMLVRLFVESFLSNTGVVHAGSLLSSSKMIHLSLHNILFFLQTILLVWIFLGLVLKKNVFSLARAILCASFLIIFPPLIDMLVTGGRVFWSFYLINDPKGLFASFLTIFGRLPSGVFYFGTKILILSAVIFSAGLVYVKSKSRLKALGSALGVYTIFFFMGSFPSWLAYAYYFFHGYWRIWDIKIYQIIQLVGTSTNLFGIKGGDIEYALAFNLNLVYFLFLLIILSVLFCLGNKRQFWAFVKNSRPPQLIYHAGLLFIGIGLGILAYPAAAQVNFFSLVSVLVLLASVWLAWKASVVFNDIYDFKIDAVSNPQRPLQSGIFDIKDYWQLGVVLFILSLFGGLIIGTRFMEMLLLYQVLAWFYSGETFRLKRIPILATFLSAVATVLILFMGFNLLSGDNNLQGLSGRIVALLLIALTLSLPIKDFKDIEGDKKDGIWTIPVIFGEEKSKLIVASGIFLSFILSVIFLNEARLFWWAILAGTSAFLVVINKKIHPYNLFWWILSIIAVYAVIMAKVIFLK